MPNHPHWTPGGHVATDPRVQDAWRRVLDAQNAYAAACLEAARDPQPLVDDQLRVSDVALEVIGEWFAYHSGMAPAPATLTDLLDRLSAKAGRAVPARVARQQHVAEPPRD